MRYLTVLIFLGLFSQCKAQNNNHSNLESGLAVQGYDPVAYFSNKGIEGNEKISTTYNNATYYFSTRANKLIFESNQLKYEPQYGGWCAYAMGKKGSKVEINPKTFKVINGKLYLFYNAYFNNTLESWNKNEEILKAKADKNWNELLK